MIVRVLRGRERAEQQPESGREREDRAGGDLPLLDLAAQDADREAAGDAEHSQTQGDRRTDERRQRRTGEADVRERVRGERSPAHDDEVAEHARGERHEAPADEGMAHEVGAEDVEPIGLPPGLGEHRLQPLLVKKSPCAVRTTRTRVPYRCVSSSSSTTSPIGP